MAKSTTTPAKAKKAMPKKAALKKAAKKIAKKAVVAKSSEKKDPLYIKYADKSPGQPEMVVIFEAIRKIILPYAGKRAFQLHEQTGGQANLVSHKPVVINGQEREMLWFVCTLVQKGYVGFYYMPMNIQDRMKKELSPEFMKCLKGKSCFHIKKNDPGIMAEIKKAIKMGYDEYLERGWI